MAAVSTKRLATWKAIAAYIGRDTRTAKRYEIERRLPVHRLPGEGRSVVYAFSDELDAWLHRHADISAEAPIPGASPLPRDVGGEGAAGTSPDSPSAPPVAAGRRRWRIALPVLGLAAAAAFIGAITLSPAQGSRGHGPGPSVAARAAFMDGQYAWRQRSPASLRQAIDDFTQAVVQDPDYGDAYIGLATSYNLMPEFGGMSAAEAYPHAEAAARRALELEPRSAAAHRTLAFIRFWWERDLPSAWREFRTAIALDPGSAESHLWYANALAEMSDPRAIHEIDLAQALDPASTAIQMDKGWDLAMLGRDAQARTALEQVERLHPTEWIVHDHLALLARREGDWGAMLDQLRRAAELRGDPEQIGLADAGREGLARGGAAGMWRALVTAEERLNAQNRFSSIALAADEMRLGARDRALALLDDASRRRDPAMVGVGVSPEFATLRENASFRRLASATTATAS